MEKEFGFGKESAASLSYELVADITTQEIKKELEEGVKIKFVFINHRKIILSTKSHNDLGAVWNISEDDVPIFGQVSKENNQILVELYNTNDEESKYFPGIEKQIKEFFK
jgi:hypothetical protein